MKSDDVVGRVKTYEAIIKGENIPESGIPESFKVLLKELQSLGLDVRLLRDDNTEVELKENVDCSDSDYHNLIEGEERRIEQNFGALGYQEQEIVGDEFVAVSDSDDSEEGDDDFADSYEDEYPDDFDDFSDDELE